MIMLTHSPLNDFLDEIKSLQAPSRVAELSRFYKTGKGQYGEGDCFLGISVPLQRKVAQKYYKLLTLEEYAILLKDPFHEVRLTTLMMMVARYEKTKEAHVKEEVFSLYLHNLEYINNWDLVDLSAYKIVGAFLWQKNHSILIEMAKSGHLWTQRVSIIATFYFIKRGEFETAFRISDLLLDHKHDLIHKAVGWMLREIGNIDRQAEIEFLNDRYNSMPRTMLRYAIEKFEEGLRLAYLKGEV